MEGVKSNICSPMTSYDTDPVVHKLWGSQPVKISFLTYFFYLLQMNGRMCRRKHLQNGLTPSWSRYYFFYDRSILWPPYSDVLFFLFIAFLFTEKSATCWGSLSRSSRWQPPPHPLRNTYRKRICKDGLWCLDPPYPTFYHSNNHFSFILSLFRNERKGKCASTI